MPEKGNDTTLETSKSDLLLKEIKSRQERTRIVDVDEEQVKMVFFTVGGTLFAFYGSDVKEILPVEKIYYVPGCPAVILGVINVRGDVESVIGLHGLLGLPEKAQTKNSRIALAQKNGIRSGILLDSVEDVDDIPVRSIAPPISTLDKNTKEFVAGETTYKNRNVTILDVGKLFSRISI
ncbi:MAG: purine-binding chemotaxis protein CheW [Nitrospirae bacterium]|nr:purine-binding chemotaxis protein CheW [Nitrospirota bacterium]